MNRFRGFHAACLSPFASDLSIDLEPLGDYASLLSSDGIDGVFVCGTTGECPSLTLEERKELAQAWGTHARALGLALMVHVGSDCLADARDLACHASRIGADGVAAWAPSVFSPLDAGSLADFLGGIASAVPDLPFFYYHMPFMTGTRVSAAAVMEEARKSIPNFRGVKYASPDLAEWHRCRLRNDGSLDLLYGCDEALLGALGPGVDGMVGSTCNFMSSAYRAMVRAWELPRLELARSLQDRASELIEGFSPYGPQAAARILLRHRGLDLGTVRPPLRWPPEEWQERLVEEARRLGIFNGV